MPLHQVLLAIDQTANTLIGGMADETISARLFRERLSSPWWMRGYRLVNALFFWQADHCAEAYEAEWDRQQLPSHYRGAP